MIKRIVKILLTLIIIISLFSCKYQESPKPLAYFRIDMPEKEYHFFDSLKPYGFELPIYSTIETDISPIAEPDWINLYFIPFDARVHLSYKKVENNLYELLEDNIRLAYNHVVKADAIEETLFLNENDNAYGILFEIKGDAASPVQFLITDSVKHFVRGSLYFNTRPNRDSLNPVISFITEDIIHLMTSLHWKD